VGAALALQSRDVEALRDLALGVLARAAANAPLASLLQAVVPIATVGAAKRDRERSEVALTLRMLASMLRDIELLHASADPKMLANPALAERLGRMAGTYDGERARRAFAASVHAIQALAPPQNAGVKVVVDWVAAQV
jgi:hypothetical protein